MVVLSLAIAVLAFGLRVFAPGPMTETNDEGVYLQRGDAFSQALQHGHLSQATAVHNFGIFANDTLPGITTMWAATLGRAVAVASGQLGLSAKVDGPSATSADVLRADRTVVALWCSISLGLFVYLAWRLMGRGTAIVAGVLLATEPWLVGHSDVLHTDAMVTMFSAVAVLALAVGLGLATRGQLTRSPRGDPHRRRRLPRIPDGTFPGWIVVSGVFAALASLTKLNALIMVVPGAVIIAAVALWRTRSSDASGSPHTGALSGAGGFWLIASWVVVGAIAFVALWPALWVAPHAQLNAIRHALQQLGGGNLQFFMGHVTNNPGPGYYPVVLLFRTTPWLLAGTAAAVAVAVLQAASRLRPSSRLAKAVSGLPHLPLWPLAVCVPYLVVISWSHKKFDRYALPVFPFMALAAGAVITTAVLLVARRINRPNLIAPAAVVATSVLALYVAAQAPYAISYADPVVGGQRVASHAIMLGWDEGMERLGADIARERSGHCGQTVVAAWSAARLAVRCGFFVPNNPNATDVNGVDYVITYINQRQRGHEDALRRVLPHEATRIDRVVIGGVTYAELWRVRNGPGIRPSAH